MGVSDIKKSEQRVNVWNGSSVML